MRWIDVPVLGRRPATEFTNAGVLEPEPEVIADREAGEWVFDRASVPKVRSEWWYHAGTQLWFLVERDTENDVVSKVELARKIT